MKKVAFFGFMVAAIAALVVVLANSSVTEEGVKVGAKSAEACKPTPDSEECLPQIGYLDTEDTMWTEDLLEGKVVMINFWATWCAPCKQEIPALSAAYQEYKDEGFVLLGVLMDSVDVTDEELAAFSEQYNLDYPVVRVDDAIYYRFGEPSALPTTFVYDRTGKLRERIRGAIPESRLEGMLKLLLAEGTGE